MRRSFFPSSTNRAFAKWLVGVYFPSGGESMKQTMWRLEGVYGGSVFHKYGGEGVGVPKANVNATHRKRLSFFAPFSKSTPHSDGLLKTGYRARDSSKPNTSIQATITLNIFLLKFPHYYPRLHSPPFTFQISLQIIQHRDLPAILSEIISIYVNLCKLTFYPTVKSLDGRMPFFPLSS